jgi:hypothetical protein
MTETFAHGQPTHLALALMTSLASTFPERGFLLYNGRTVGAEYFTRAG